MVTVDGFDDDFERDLVSALWTLPNGIRVLCCKSEHGFILYERDDWNNTTTTEWESDKKGHVTRLGRYQDYNNPDWIVPKEIRDAAIS